ncbi:MAG: flavin reductase [Dehalococcoidales bacterium]|nr:flavin reductase [Dehalococcoidales bacterium]
MDINQFINSNILDKTLSFLPSPGLLLAAGSFSGVKNVMTIGWMTFGVVWNRPICVIMVRPTRYTYSLIEETNSFTVNVPAPGMEDITAFCGCNSRNEVDKITALGMAFFKAKTVDSINLDNCLLTYECRVAGKCDMYPYMIADDVLLNHYKGGTRKDNYHRVFFGEIMNIQEE